MKNYLNSECPYCGKKFTENDDIVVCPDCGTPHHRECYKEHGNCANSELHGNFEWGIPSESKTYESNSESEHNIDSFACPNCGGMNPVGTNFCAHCGAPLPTENNTRRTPEFTVTRIDGMGNDMDGENPMDVAQYVRTNIGYFLPRFISFTKGNKFDTNFSAFIFSYFYLFYRKMYALGIAVFVSTTILSIPAFLLDFATLQEAYIKLGLLSQKIWEVPHTDVLTIYGFVASILVWGIRIGLMLFFNRIYYRKAVLVVKGIKKGLQEANALNDMNFAVFARKKGGTSYVGPIIIAAVIFAASMLLAYVIVSSPYFIMPTAI